MRYLVTGAAGFIGSHLVHRLLDDGADVVALDDLSGGRRDRLPRDGTSRFRFVRGDVRDAETCDAACRGVDIVLHQAAAVSVPRSVRNPIETFDVNVSGTFHMMEAARHAGVSRFVYASSCAVYGDGPELPKTEALPSSPRSPYAASKAAGEQLAISYSASMGLSTIGLRYFNVFGPGQDPDGPYAAVVAAFTTRCIAGTTPTIYGDGEQSRDFVFVEDIVQANLLAARASDEASGAVYNVGSGKRTTVRELHAAIAEAAAATPTVDFAPARAGDVEHSVADIAAARRRLGYQPRVPFAQGIQATVDWYRSRAMRGAA